METIITVFLQIKYRKMQHGLPKGNSKFLSKAQPTPPDIHPKDIISLNLA